jgi:hypothetical protein
VNPQTKLLLTRWGPFAAIVVVLALVLVIAPTKSPDRTNPFAGIGTGTQSVTAAGAAPGQSAAGAPTTPGAVAGGGATGSATADAAAAGAPASGATGSASSGAASVAPAASAVADGGVDCARQEILGPETQCKPLWSGDNGGATYKGLTGDSIKVVYYLTKANEQVNAILRAGGAGASREEIKHTIEVYLSFFNKHWQTYGRKLDLVIYEGEAESGDAAAFRAEAVKIDQEIGAYMVFGAGNTDMIDELARRGIVCICGAQLPGAFHIERAPFVFGILSDGDTTNKHIAEYICNRLGPGGGKAEFAGQLIHPTIGGRDTPRRFGMSYPENGFGTPNAEDLERRLNACGIQIVRKNAYASDINTAGQQSTTSVQGSIEAKVTTVICVCDPIAPVFGTQAASQQQYYPEWFQTGYLLQDAEFFGRLYDQNQWNHNFGISTLPVPKPRTDGAFWKAYKSEDPNTDPPVGAELIYPALLVGFYGIELAGPHLDPATYRDGMYAIQVESPDKHTVAFGYGPDDFGGIDDAREVWWDPAGIHPADGKPGTYHNVNDGARYKPGEWPTTHPNVFKPECDAAGSCGAPPRWP